MRLGFQHVWRPCRASSPVSFGATREVHFSTSLSFPSSHSNNAELSSKRAKTRVAGKTAIVTGGSRGIGLAIASRLAQEGFSCTLVGRDQGTLQRAVESLPRQSLLDTDGHSANILQHQLVVGDVCDADFWTSVCAQVPNARFLINAAGVSQASLLARMQPAEIRQILDVNLYGAIYGCRSIMRTWLKNRSSDDKCIINISSLLALRGGHGASVYAAAKAGLIGLTRALAEEGSGRNIRCNVILPGYVETDMTAHFSGQHQETLKKKIPAGRFGTPDEIADAALFLAQNEYANNCVLNIDGGLSAAA